MQCIIYTNSTRLAAKYRCSQQDVISLLEKNLTSQQVIDFFILDVAEYQDEFGTKPTWEGHKAILADFMAGMGLSPSPRLALFIVGGDDVIPMPRIENPINEEEQLQADLLYCFASNEIDCLNANDAQCNVGRLPLESGSLPSSLTDDLQSYFNLSNMMLNTGIDVNKVLMTSAESFLPAGNDMVRGLPVDKLPQIPDTTCGNVFKSPRLAIDDEYVYKHYRREIGQADMLMFNLHGSDARGYSSFYGEGIHGHNTPEAFSCEMLKYSGARIFNTVACYGARYIGYNRKDSMLMSALYGGGVVLYAGSCSSALGRSGRANNAAQDILTPSGYSESFMKLYSLYLFGGITAGEAFLYAKCGYFNQCRSLDGDDCALATVLMFNLFGLPVLSVNKNTDVLQEARGLKNVSDTKIQKKSTRVLYEKKQESTAILTDVRMRVDSSLLKIKNTIQTKLYAYWGLNPADLEKVVELYDGKEKTFRFEYGSKNEIIDKRAWALVDNQGYIKDVAHFK